MIENEFKCLKETIINLIKDKNEITSKTSFRTGGIYMIYIDSFCDDKIIPFYIGKTQNFQDRHKEHMKEIFALNRLYNNYYLSAIINNYFEGYYKSCKIFKYLVDNECELKDIHMIILEECENEKERTQLEIEYINKYLATFFGFNQLNSISLASNNGSLGTDYRKYIKTDIENIKKYTNYGFNRLNYILAKKIFENYEPILFKELNEVKKFKEKDNLIFKDRELNEERNNLKTYISKTSKTQCKALCMDIIDGFFEKNGLKSEDKKEQIVEVLLYEKEKTRKEVIQYIKRFGKTEEDIFSTILNGANSEQIKKINSAIKEKQDRVYKCEDEIYNVRLSIFEDIVPKKEYKIFPLKDLYNPNTILKIDQIGEDNILYINIEYSNHGRRIMQDDYPEPLKVDYAFYKGFDKYKKSYFISSVMDKFFEDESLYVINTGNNYFFSKPSPFALSKIGEYGYTISTTMEYCNGINEFTLKDKEKHKFRDVISEIDALIDENTKIVYTSNSKKTIKMWAESDWVKDSILMTKLLKFIKY